MTRLPGVLIFAVLWTVGCCALTGWAFHHARRLAADPERQAEARSARAAAAIAALASVVIFAAVHLTWPKG
jgi:hypothetical protein